MEERTGFSRAPGVVLLCALFFAISASSLAAPLENYGRLPSLEEVQLSPDGSRIAFVRTEKEERYIVVKEVQDRKFVAGLRVGPVKLRGLGWADAGHLLIYSSVTGMPMALRGEAAEWMQLQVFDLASKKIVMFPDAVRLSGRLGGLRVLNTVRGPAQVRRVDGQTVLFVPCTYIAETTLPMMVRLDLASGSQTIVQKSSSYNEEWFVGPDGSIASDEDYDEERQDWSIRVQVAGVWKKAASGNAPVEIPYVLGLSADGASLVISFFEGGQWVERQVSLRDGTLSAPLPQYAHMRSPVLERVGDRLIGRVVVDDDHRYFFFDPDQQRHWEAIVRAFPAAHLQLESFSDDFRKLIVLVESHAVGLTYFYVDLDAHRSFPVGDEYEGIDNPATVKRIDYEAADSLRIPAYLTLPGDRPEKSLALVVLPHGGPAARDTAEFHWMAQAIASQGYAVLQANFRGSSLDRQHLEAGFGQWGRKMQTDLSDGVRYLVAQGIVDPGRVCIVGASYGGYAALAGVTLDPGTYRCAVSIAGISDLRRMLHWVDDRHLVSDNRTQRYWDRFLGVGGMSDPLLEQISPARHAAGVGAPVLLIHGEDDTVVPIEQSERMESALRKAGGTVEFLHLKGEDHWLSRNATRAQTLQALMDFLHRYNPADPAPAATVAPASAGRP